MTPLSPGTDPQSWLTDWFERRGSGVLAGPLDPARNFFDLGVIDSLGMLDLIVSVEDAFGIRLNEQHLQDPRFPTISGLAQIVRELRADRA